jgi:ubiquinone/menaquinone biosynthesis C-methylase UbiE
MKKPDYAEFTNPKLARVYDSFNSFTEDEGFWLNIVKKNGVKNIVDLGCGTGLLTCELAKLGYKTIGIDPASPMIEIAQKKLYGDKAE